MGKVLRPEIKEWEKKGQRKKNQAETFGEKQLRGKKEKGEAGVLWKKKKKSK